MRHDEIREQLFALCDGPLTESERRLVDGHLAQCGECRQAVSEWKENASALFPPVVVPEAEEDRFTAAVMARVKAHPLSDRLTRMGVVRWFLPLLSSAAVAAWVLFSVLPRTPEFTPVQEAEAYFYEETLTPSAGWEMMSPAPPAHAVVVSFIRK